METDPVELSTLLAVTAIVAAMELAARIAAGAAIAPALVCTGAARLAASAVLLAAAGNLPRGPASIGLARSTVAAGIKRGLLWSAAFGVLAGLGVAGCTLAGVDALGLLRVPLPRSPAAVLTYFGVGAVLAPVTEELYFRGFLYGWLRRWGPAAAVVGSTLLFVAAHPDLQSIPVTQLAGGLAFALSYEIEKNLMVPITLHACGNAALFSLSLLL